MVLLSFSLGLSAQQQEFPAGGVPANPAATGNDTVASQLNQQPGSRLWKKEFTDAAEAMPAEKYTFVPTNEFPNGSFMGVRNFAQQVMHVAQANYQLYGAIIPDDLAIAAARQAAASATTKDQIVQYLRDSFAFAHKAIGTITPDNMLKPVRRAPNAVRRHAASEVAIFGCSTRAATSMAKWWNTSE